MALFDQDQVRPSEGSQVVRDAGTDDPSPDDDDPGPLRKLGGHAGIVFSPRADSPDCERPAVSQGGAADVDGILRRLDCLQGKDWSATTLSGGLTNRNVKIACGDAVMVVRISHPDSGLLAIDRPAEHFNSVAAAECGVGAPVIEYRPDLNAMVVGFIDARTCSRADLDDAERLTRVVTACRSLHSGRRFANDFDMFRLQPYYLQVVRDRGFRLPGGYRDFMPHLERVQAALGATDEGTVPCHNDLLAENCLDDGTKVWLIDYEYAGNNDPCFELGNLWSESDLSLDHLEHIVACYYDFPDPQKVARARLQGIVSKYGWTLWASIQDSTAPLNFDFWSWGMEKYERAVSEFSASSFDRLLDLAAGGWSAGHR